VRRLGTAGLVRERAERELHARLVRIALAEVRRRAPVTAVSGPELEDVAHQAAADAMLAILAKLGDFRGASRFITWAYRFVILEVSAKLGRHYWRNPPVALDAGSESGSRTGSGSTRPGTRSRPTCWPRCGVSSMRS
jgi:RNA polymerase sigma-70 factor, ECF subfamily